jgi:hypothetical protein
MVMYFFARCRLVNGYIQTNRMYTLCSFTLYIFNLMTFSLKQKELRVPIVSSFIIDNNQ